VVGAVSIAGSPIVDDLSKVMLTLGAVLTFGTILILIAVLALVESMRYLGKILAA
jgi:hypothetical protein